MSSEEGVVRICTKCNKEVEKGIPFLNVPGGVCHQSCFSIGTCHGCSKELLAAEQIMEALNKKYHSSCFKCKMCQNPLQGSFVNYNEEPHCKTCIESLKAKQAQAVRGECGICSQGIVASARAISFNNKMYHADCFVCYNCKGPFSSGVAEVNNNFYCAPCVQLKKEELQKQQQQYQQTVSQLQQNNNQPNQQPGILVCASCNQQIVSGKVVNVLGRTWHLDCLKCVVCSKSLSDGKLGNVNNQPHCVPCAQNAQQSLVNQQQQQQQALEEQHNKLEQQRRELSKQWDEFQAKASGSTQTTVYDTVDCSVCMTKIKGEYQELAGQAYCNDCANLVQRSLQCDVCRKVISGGVSFRTALGKTFHKECFKCAHCKVVIEGKKFKANEGKIYCDNDYTTLFGVFKEKCPKCDKVINQGEVLTHNEISYHSACFLCHHCNSPFVGGQYMPGKSGQLYCRECFLQGHFL